MIFKDMAAQQFANILFSKQIKRVDLIFFITMFLYFLDFSAAQQAIAQECNKKLTVQPKSGSLCKVLVIGQKIQLEARELGEDGKKRPKTKQSSWFSDDDEVVSVRDKPDSSKGRAEATGIGRAEISATFDGNIGCITLNVIDSVDDKNLDISLEQNPIEFRPPFVQVGANAFLDDGLAPSTGNILDLTDCSDWSSTNPDIAIVSDNHGSKGLVSVKGVGDAVITADFEGAEGRIKPGIIGKPIADAGPNQNVLVGTIVTLDGSGSDGNGSEELSFQWNIIDSPPGSTAMLNQATSVMPTFTPDVPGQYTIELVVTNEFMTSSDPDTVVITAGSNVPKPTAHAGPNQSVAVGTTVTLDGSGSQPEGMISFQWEIAELPPGSLSMLNQANTAMPTFTPDVVGEYVVQLVVMDDLSIIPSDPDTVVITAVPNAPRPTAQAGSNQSVTVSTTVTLDGSGSQPEGMISFQWEITEPPQGSLAILNQANTAMPTFIPDIPGQYVISLIVTDMSMTLSLPDTVVINAILPIDQPIANAGSDQSVFLGQTVILNGHASQPQGALNFSWDIFELPIGSTSVLNLPNTGMPTFVPDQPGQYTVRLFVTDESGMTSAPDFVNIAVNAVEPVVFARGIGLQTAPENQEGGFVDLNVRGEIIQAFLTWQGGEGDQHIILNGALIEGRESIDPENRKFRCFIAEIKDQIAPGFQSYHIQASEDSLSPLVGAGIVVIASEDDIHFEKMPNRDNAHLRSIYQLGFGAPDHPQRHIEVKAGCDFFHHTDSDPRRFTSDPVRFNFLPSERNRLAKLTLMVGEAQTNDMDRRSEILFFAPADTEAPLSLGKNRTGLIANDGCNWDTVGRDSGIEMEEAVTSCSPGEFPATQDPDPRGTVEIPAGTTSASVQLISPTSTNPKGVSATFLLAIFDLLEPPMQ